MKKTITIRIYPDGTIHSETHGIKGPSCTTLIPVLEELLNAETTDSKLTPEYHEIASEQHTEINQESRNAF
jgi:hypothetical protein